MLTVHNLVCHNHVDMAILCLGSLLKFSAEPIRLMLHDDGSLTMEDIEKLQTNLMNSKLILRAEADDLLNSLLKGYPNAYRYRYEHPLSIKLLDIPILEEEDVAYCDSDILFLKPFSKMFHQFDESSSATFMMDYQESYSVRPWHLLQEREFGLPSQVNTGIMFLKKSIYDLEFIEWFLGQGDRFRYHIGWLEQTCWAALGYRANCRLWNPQQIVTVETEQSITSDAVAGHFTSSSRYLLNKFVSQKSQFAQESVPTVVDTIPSRKCNAWNLAQTQVGRDVRRFKPHRSLMKAFR